MPRAVFRRDEFLSASLDLGSSAIDLADYATTGLRVVASGPSGIGKTNVGLLIAEQLAEQGWYAILIDPEAELAELYGCVLDGADDVTRHLEARNGPAIATVPVRDAEGFIPVARALFDVVDRTRRPVFLMLDEGQLFSSSARRRKSTDPLGEASDLVNDFVQRGRKRALDLFLSAHRFSGSLSRAVFALKNLTLVGRQEDPAAWASLAPQFKGSGITYPETAALSPGEFFCFSRRGVEKVVTPLARALATVAPAATRVRPQHPTTFAQWDRAMQEISLPRLHALSGPMIALLGSLAGCTPQQLAAGTRALHDEIGARG